MIRFPERHRVLEGPLASAPGDAGGAFAFLLSGGESGFAIAGVGDGWEHVSVSLQNRCPTWSEMCAVKAAFWDPEDCVVQFHPPQSRYVNHYPYCLHMWRSLDAAQPMPPEWMVGPKG